MTSISSSSSPTKLENSRGENGDNGGRPDDEHDGVFYFLNGSIYGSLDEEHIMEEWLEEFGLRESEEWFLEWSKVLGKIAIALQDLEKKLRPKLMEPIFGAVFARMYLNYYTGPAFWNSSGPMQTR